VEIFNFFRSVLVITVTTTLFWPLTVPLAALAYKVRNGAAPIPIEPRPFWTRCAFAALGMALMALVLAALDSLLVRGMEFPAGLIQIALFLLYVPAATRFLTWIFALEDLAQGLALLVVWIALPGMVLAGLRVVGFTLPLELAETWLPTIPS
jgi:hypothetical protein